MIKYDNIEEDVKTPGDKINNPSSRPESEKSNSENPVKPVSKKKITFNFGQIEEEVRTDQISNLSKSQSISRKSENNQEFNPNEHDNNYLNDSIRSSDDGSDRAGMQTIREEDEKILGKFLKISHLIGEKKIKHKEESKKMNNLNMGPVVESDEEVNLETIVKEIDKKPIPENFYYFIDGDNIKYRAESKNKRRKKNKIEGLQDLKLSNNKGVLIEGQEDEDSIDDEVPCCIIEDSSNINANMDLDDIYAKMKQ